MNDNDPREIDALRLDAVVRARHADALARISPRVQAQLAQRSNLALRGAVRQPSHGLRNAALAFAALAALALGLRFQFAPEAGPVAPVATHADPASAPPDTAAVGTALDQDPEFYVWLGASGSDRLAVE